MTHPSNLAEWVTGVSDFEHMIKNLQLDVRLDKHIVNTDLCQEWYSIKSRISPYEFLYKKYNIPKLIHKRWGPKKRIVQQKA
jgi:hypothetical protein